MSTDTLVAQAVDYAKSRDGKRWSVHAAINFIMPQVEPEHRHAVKQAIVALKRPPKKRRVGR